MRGEVAFISGRTIRYYAIAWFLMVLFAHHLGILQYLQEDMTIPDIQLPQPTDQVAEIVTQNVLEIQNVTTQNGVTEITFKAGSIEEANAAIYVNDLEVYSQPLTPGYATIIAYKAKIPDDANITVRLVKPDGTTLLEEAVIR